MSCLFDSLSYLLKDDLREHNITDLREAVCNFMEDSSNKKIKGVKIKDWVSYSSDLPTKEYINHMRDNGEWGGGTEIAVASKMFNVIINVLYRGEQIAKFDSCNRNPSKEITLNYTGNHYEPNEVTYIY